MKNKIPFNFFGEEQEICFTIGGVREFERTLGKTIGQILLSQYDGVDFVLTALPIALKRIQPLLYEEKIEKYLTEDYGRSINDIAFPVLYALFLSGAAGKTWQDVAIARYFPEALKPVEDEQAKNE